MDTVIVDARRDAARRNRSGPRIPSFGRGGSEPYAAALGSGPADALSLVSVDDPMRDGVLMDVARWSAPADEADLSALAVAVGPVLDVGCGPGRMVRAALEAGLPALGIDASPEAAGACRALGLPVLCRSVFEPLPREGAWGTVLLIDGNIGIGGDVAELLGRCRELIRHGGRLVVETARDPDVDRRFQGRLVAASGAASDVFPWAEIGASALGVVARRVGLHPGAVWSSCGRAFCALQRTA